MRLGNLIIPRPNQSGQKRGTKHDYEDRHNSKPNARFYVDMLLSETVGGVHRDVFEK